MYKRVLNYFSTVPFGRIVGINILVSVLMIAPAYITLFIFLNLRNQFSIGLFVSFVLSLVFCILIFVGSNMLLHRNNEKKKEYDNQPLTLQSVITKILILLVIILVFTGSVFFPIIINMFREIT